MRLPDTGPVMMQASLHVIYVIGIIIWAVLVLHAIADRSVLNIRTLATCAVAGALWGPFLYNSSSRFLSIFGFDPDKDNLIPLFSICLMALFIWWCFFRPRLHRLTSVADGFLVGFMFGFGYDAMSLSFVATKTFRTTEIVNFFPPFSVNWSHYPSSPGLGYWLALVVLVAASTLRFWRRTALAIAIAAVLLLLAGLDLPPRVETSVAAITWYRAQLDGRGWLLVVWVALVALLVASIYEGTWVRQTLGSRDRTHSIVEEWQALWACLTDFRWKHATELKSAFRKRRQWELIRAELKYPPEDHQAERFEINIGKELAGYSDRDALLNQVTDTGARSIKDRIKRTKVPLVICLFVYGTLIVGPLLSDAFYTRFWTMPIIFDRAWSNANICWLDSALIAFILLSCITFPTASARLKDANNALQYRAEQALLAISLFFSALALSIPYDPLLFGLASPLFPLMFHIYTVWRFATVMLLIAAAGCSLTWIRHADSKDQPRVERLAAMFANLVITVGAFAAFLLTIWLFRLVSGFLSTAMQSQFTSWFSSNAGAVRETICLVVAVILGLTVLHFLFRFSNRLRRPA